MEPSDTIGRVGFRKWYERQLIEAHAWLVTCLLSGFAALAAYEAMTFREGVLRGALLLGLIALALLAGAFGWTRYRVLMVEANRLAQRSVCPGCGAYGLFRVARAPRGAVMDVRCRKCSADWTIS